MKRTLLLSLGLLSLTSLGIQAQVLMTEGFNGAQTKTATDVGYYEFINQLDGDKWELTTSTQSEGAGSLHFYNSDANEGSTWQRSVKFRNIPIEENTSYRVSYSIKGSKTYNLDGTTDQTTKVDCKLMQGIDDYDIPFATAAGSTFRYNDTGIDDMSFKKFTHLFYYKDAATQAAYYPTSKSGEQPEDVKNKFFLALSVYNPGDFYLDDVVIEKASVQGIAFNYDVIRVNFGYPTNYKDLLAAAGTTKIVYPEGTCTVKMNGAEVNVLTTELHNDGYLYVFLDDQYPETGTEQISVSFNNPSDAAYQLLYSGDLAPEGPVFNFVDEPGTLDQNITDIFSSAYDLPVIKTAVPEKGSFNLPVDQKEFKVVFNKKADASKVVATLGSEPLTVSPNTGYATDFTFTRTGTGDLSAGEHDLILTKVYPEAVLDESVFTSATLELSFGQVNANPNDTAYFVMKDSIAQTIASLGEGFVPKGWTIYNAANVVAQGTNPGSGPRSFKFADGGDFTGAIYFRTAAADDGGRVIYGETDGYKLSLESGKKYKLMYNIAAWKGTPYVKFELVGPDDNVVLTRVDAAKPNMNGAKNAITGSVAIEESLQPVASGDYKLRWTPASDADGNQGAWVETLLGNVKVQYLPNVMGVEETTQLKNALAAAKDALAANSGERYAGTDFDALQAAVNEIDGKTYTAPSVYKAATARLANGTLALKNHRQLCDTYDPLVAAAKAARDMRTGTKFQAHVTYTNIEASIAKYDGQVLTDNAELQAAITELKTNTAAVTNIGTVVQTLSASTVSGLAVATKLGTATDELTAAVNNMLTDDADVKAQVKAAIKQGLYTQLKDPNNTLFAQKVDETTLENYVDTFDLSIFVNNPDLYVTAAQDVTGVVSTENTPGWTITPGEGWTGGWSYHYPWGANQSYKYDAATCPVANSMIASWGYKYTIEQQITDLPAGTYNIYAKAVLRGGDYSDAYFYVTTSAKTDSVQAIMGTASVEPQLTNGYFVVVKDVVVTDGQLGLRFTPGSDTRSFFDGVVLVLKGAAPGFDYATGIRGVVDSSDAQVKKVEYFDLSGRQLGGLNTTGVTILKQTMTDGSVKTTKVLKK